MRRAPRCRIQFAALPFYHQPPPPLPHFPHFADLTGAFVNPDQVYLQSTGFVLDPQGKVVVSVYSSGAIGRLVPDDVAGLVR